MIGTPRVHAYAGGWTRVPRRNGAHRAGSFADRGPRLGEACGLKDAEVRLDQRSARVVNQITMGRDRLVQKPPKSTAGNRDLFYDNDTTMVLTTYKKTTAAWKLATGPIWPNTGLFFVRPDGTPWPRTGWCAATIAVSTPNRPIHDQLCV
jgi:hypothetical protein